MSDTAGPTVRRSIDVVTYNIRRGVGADGVRDLDRIGEVLATIDADVVALQEVDSESADDDRHTLERLGATLDMRAIAGSTMRRDNAGYGNGLLVRPPVETVRRHDLSVSGREPRGALEVALRVGGRSLAVLTTHLGLSAGERRVQSARLLERIRDVPETDLVVLGDFNEWWPLARFGRAVTRLLGPTPAPGTFPARMPLVALDRIWVRPSERLEKLRAVRTPLSRVASDHVPLVATLRWP